MKMTILYIAGGVIAIIILIYVIGLLLPTERVISKKGSFPIPPEILYEIVTNNHDWQYRRSLKDLTILESKNEMEIWEETTHDGTVIRFQTLKKLPSSFYSFNMETALFTGYWTGEFETDQQNGTLFTTTEYIRIKNPFIKTLSYLFFDIDKLMEEYLEDLQIKIR